MIINILIVVNLILVICIVYIFIILIKANKLNHTLRYEISQINLQLKKSNVIYKDMTNEELINKFNNVGLIRFIKERFNLPDYCKCCNNFNPIDSNLDICRFKGMIDTKCEEGFKKWLKDHNNLEGDMNADIN